MDPPDTTATASLRQQDTGRSSKRGLDRSEDGSCQPVRTIALFPGSLLLAVRALSPWMTAQTVILLVTSVALEVVENKGLKKTVVPASVASFGK